MIPKAPKVAAPEKELRFTRSGQALGFWFAAMALVAVAIAIAVAGSGRLTDPDQIHPAWAAAPVVAAWLLARLAMRLTRHAYLILTPIGIEVFPFFRPADRMQVIAWSEITDAEVDARLHRLTLHFDAGRTSGVHLTLRPLREPLRPLLVEAVLGRVRGNA